MKLEQTQINESPVDIPSDISLEQQLNLVSQRLEVAKRALGVANRFRSPDAKKKHRGRILGIINQLRKLLRDISKQLEADINSQPEVVTSQPIQPSVQSGDQQPAAFAYRAEG